MARQRKQQNKQLQCPVTVRQAQKLLSKVPDDCWMPRRYRPILSAIDGVGRGVDDFEIRPVIRERLARLASKDPNQILVDAKGNAVPLADSEIEAKEQGESRPKGTDEVRPQSDNPSEDSEFHGGDGNSGECDAPAQTSSDAARDGQESDGSRSDNGQPQANNPGTSGSQSQGDGNPQEGESPSERGAGMSSDGSETGNATSEDQAMPGDSQNPGSQQGTSPSTAMGDDGLGQKTSQQSELGTAPERNPGTDTPAAPRDGHGQESGDSHDAAPSGDRADCDDSSALKGEEQSGTKAIAAKIAASEPGRETDCQMTGDQPGDDRPTHQKKWGKKFSKAEVGKGKLSTSANSNFGGMTAELKEAGISPKLLRLCRQRLAALVGDSSQDYGPRRDYTEFCVRLKTYRNPQPARQEGSGRPVILIMADVSGSCSSFSGKSVAVAKVASSLGVPGADVLVLTHSNGYPCELEHNGKAVDIASIGQQSGDEHAHQNAAWYTGLLNRYQIEAAIALGDWDAADDYLHIAQHPTVNRFIWLDNAYCSSRGTVEDKTRVALSRIAEWGAKVSGVRHKLTYKDGCKDAKAFIQEIK